MKQHSFNPDSAQKISLISAFVCIVLGIAYSIKTLNLPEAAIGNPNAPKVFPLSLGILMTILGVVLLIQQVMKVRTGSPEQNASETQTEKKSFVIEPHTKQIAITVANGILYAILFRRIGYVLSTILFLGIELLLFNGKTKWKTVIIVSVVFSLFIYILFNKLLGVYLPMMPVVGF